MKRREFDGIVPFVLMCIALVIYLVTLGVMLCGCSEDDPRPDNLAAGSAFRGEYYFIAAGVAPKDTMECGRWAYGEDFETIKFYLLNDVWNVRHGELFLIHDSDRLDVGMGKVAREWLKL